MENKDKIIMDKSNKDKTILSLCSGTGSWEKPYVEAGYNVISITLPYYDINLTRIEDDRLTFCSPNGNSASYNRKTKCLWYSGRAALHNVFFRPNQRKEAKRFKRRYGMCQNLS